MGAPVCPYCAEAIAPGAARCEACGESLVERAAPPVKARSTATVIVIIVAVLFVVGVCVLGILATLLMPALMKAKQKANRTKCANHLRMVGLSMLQYADDKRGFPHVRGKEELDGDVTTSDSPKIARALIWHGYLDTPDTLVCPESLDWARSPVVTGSMRTWFWDGRTVPEGAASPFTDGQPDPALDQTDELSYGWTRRALSANARSTTLLSADRALRGDPGALMGNHRDGANVGHVDGTVRWAPGYDDALTSTDAADPGAGFLSIDGSQGR